MELNIRINFDMDGTIADLYGNPNWLALLEAEDTSVYAEAEPLLRLSALAKRINHLQKMGYEIGIISWTSKTGSDAYNEAVTEAKMRWLAQHLPSVEWDVIHIVPYGTPKQIFCDSVLDILFDDEAKNRDNWTGRAYGVDDILGTLETIRRGYQWDAFAQWLESEGE